MFILAICLGIFQWRAQIARYHQGISVFEAVDLSLVGVDMLFVLEHTGGLGEEILPGQSLNESSIIRRWLGQSYRYSEDSFAEIGLDQEGKLVDSSGGALRIFYLGDGTVEIEDRCLDRLRHRFQIVVWSVGQNGVDECGAGDDLFQGVDHEGNLWRDPSLWVRFVRRGHL